MVAEIVHVSPDWRAFASITSAGEAKLLAGDKTSAAKAKRYLDAMIL
jgi:hypothetical protein